MLKYFNDETLNSALKVENLKHRESAKNETFVCLGLSKYNS